MIIIVVGCIVQNSSNEELGTITKVDNFGAGDLINIQNEKYFKMAEIAKHNGVKLCIENIFPYTNLHFTALPSEVSNNIGEINIGEISKTYVKSDTNIPSPSPAPLTPNTQENCMIKLCYAPPIRPNKNPPNMDAFKKLKL